MRAIKKIYDVVDWGLCVGCGACLSYCDKNAVTMTNIISVGIRPVFDRKVCCQCIDCLSFCPGHSVNAQSDDLLTAQMSDHKQIGPYQKIWEGYASDSEIRFHGSSGGIISALAMYYLEKESAALVLHTGMDSKKTWLNTTVISKNRDDIIKHAGSRYQTSSPCDKLDIIENSDKPCVFIGRPCDVAAVAILRKQRPKLDANLGLVLSFFCAGTPSTQGTLDLIEQMDIETHEIEELRYRGKGWPGGFSIAQKGNTKNRFMSYTESWGFLNDYRTFRCQLCPDGLGELADISCGDAWHRYKSQNSDPGQSLVLARSKHGQIIVERALAAGYLTLTDSSSLNVIKAQGLVERRKVIWGRLLAMRLLLVPVTRFSGFYLFKNWLGISLVNKIKSILGTMRRVVFRGLWLRKPVDSGKVPQG